MSVEPHLIPSIPISGDSQKLAPVSTSLLAKAAPWLFSLSVFFVYLSFPTRVYYWDGIDFAIAIENAQGFSPALIHPHHLLYNISGYSIYHLITAAGGTCRAVHVLQYINAVASALSALLFFHFLRHTFRTTYLSLFLTFLFSFSSMWWKYSTDADAYVPSLLLLLLCLNLVMVARRPRPLLIALAHTAAMCLHQLAVFFFPVILLGLFWRTAGRETRVRLSVILRYSIGAALLTLAVNYYCFHLQTGSFQPGDFIRWLTTYLHGPQPYSFSFDLRNNIFYTLRGHIRLFFEGRVTWLRGFMSVPVILLTVSLTVSAVTLAFRCILGCRSFFVFAATKEQFPRRLLRVTTLCLLWAGVYLGFLFIWYPYFTPYRLYYLPALIVLLGVILTRFRVLESPARRVSAALFAIVLGLSNFLFFIYPLSHPERNPPLLLALSLHEQWPSGTTIYYAATTTDNRLFQYFNPTTIWQSLGLVEDRRFETELEELYRQGATAWLDETALKQIQATPEGRAWLSLHCRPESEVSLADQGFAITFAQIFPLTMTAGTLNSGNFAKAALNK